MPQKVCSTLSLYAIYGVWHVWALRASSFDQQLDALCPGPKGRVGPHLTDTQTSSIRHADPVYAWCFCYIALPCFVHLLLLIHASSLFWSVFWILLLFVSFLLRLLFCLILGHHSVCFTAVLCNATQYCAKCVYEYVCVCAAANADYLVARRLFVYARKPTCYICSSLALNSPLEVSRVPKRAKESARQERALALKRRLPLVVNRVRPVQSNVSKYDDSV